MLLATMPFSISMHYCKGSIESICTTPGNCCSPNSKNILVSNEEINLCCTTDCCSELSITSLPKDQFKNNPTDEIKHHYDFIGLVNCISSYQNKQQYLSNNIKLIPPLLVYKAYAFNQCFLC